MDWTGIATLIGSIGGILTIVASPFIVHYINSQSKKIDYKLEKVREDDKRKFEEDKIKLSNTYSMIYSYMHKLLYDLDADRVFVIQPHPLSNKEFISVSLEVVQPNRDVVSHKENFQYRSMSEWAIFCGNANKNDWIIHKNIEEIRDPKLKTEFARRGVKTLFFRRMKNVDNSWIGTLCVEWTHSTPEHYDYIKDKITKKASYIEDILPEYKP